MTSCASSSRPIPSAESPFFREAATREPGAENITDVKFTNRQMRITRIAVAPGRTLDQSTAPREPALIVALKDGTLAGFQSGGATTIAAGRERWLDAGQQVRLNNTGSAPAELLRIDFLTAPRK